ncbi:MAG: hypothetical protein HWN68_02170 [Desulfobacterales bacterium]|nr:hypothetical protein [Desulfobacterales bacterium]
MAQREYEKPLIDLPHFTRDKQLSSCLQVRDAKDGSLFFNIRSQKGKASTKLGRSEIALIVLELQAWFNRTA